MDLPHRDIKFTTTNDGVGIAYWEIGSGSPLVIVNNWTLSHAEWEWTLPSVASFYVELAKRYRVIRFDPRGIGLSGDPPGGWGAATATGAQVGMSTHELGLDISAVAAACGLETFALMAVAVQGPICIEFAATHPDLVTALILADALAKVEGSFLAHSLRAFLALEEAEEELGERMVASMWDRFGPEDEMVRRGEIEWDMKSRIPGAIGTLTQLEWDAERLLEAVGAPTLVLTSGLGPDDARRLAAGIPNARLRVVDGTFAPYAADQAAIHRAIDDLLEPPEATGDPVFSGFRTVVFTDIVGSTEFVRSVGDEAGRAVVRDLEQLIASLAADHGGRVIKNLGDGSLVSFGSNSSAIRFALDLQDACGDGPLQLRIGMAAGEPIQEDGDIHGTVVARASRIGDLGEAGEVVVADSVRQLAAGKGFNFEPKGEVSLKGFDEPERIWIDTRP